jgi:hypothetical protein
MVRIQGSDRDSNSLGGKLFQSQHMMATRRISERRAGLLVRGAN